MRRFTYILTWVLLLSAPVWLSRAADAPATFKVGEFTFARPAAWQWVETTSSMRKAQLKIPGAANQSPGEIVFYYFGQGNGGGVQANVDRWLSQFQEPKDKIHSKVDEKKVGDRKVTYVQAEGTYLSGMPGGPKTPQADTMLLGAILESSEGNVFIKLTGPTALVKSSQEPFRKMAESPLK